jgi:hypothetical protein
MGSGHFHRLECALAQIDDAQSTVAEEIAARLALDAIGRAIVKVRVARPRSPYSNRSRPDHDARAGGVIQSLMLNPPTGRFSHYSALIMSAPAVTEQFWVLA